MRRLPAGVSLITTTAESTPYGLVATAVTSVSAEPPTLLVCVNRSASIHEHILKARRFAVNILSADQAGIATRFASTKDRDRRFETGEWQVGTTGIPLLAGSCVSFECTTSGTTVQGTHTVLFGLVEEVWLQSEIPPLTYHNGIFGTPTALAF